MALALAWAPTCTANEAETVKAVLAAKPAGAVVRLGDSGRVTGLHMEPAGGAPVGGVVILHPHGSHLNSAGTVRTLRRGLPKSGWHTLSIQLPRNSGAPRPWHRRVAARLGLAVKFLRKMGVLNVVVIAHGAAAGAAARYFSGGADASVTGFVGVSPVYLGPSSRESLGQLSDAWPKKLLEIYGERDLPGVRRQVKKHAEQTTSLPDLQWSSIEVGGARHGLKRQANEVLRRVRGWLDRRLSGQEVTS